MGATLLCSTLLATAGHQAQAQAPAAATVTEILDSNQVYIQNRAARVNSVAQQRQQVRTQSARASLRFNSGAVARLAHNSSLVVGQCAQLNRGTLLVNGNLNGCSTSTVAGVRGTIYTIEVTEAGETIIQVFEGEVVVQRNPNPVPVNPATDDFDALDPSLDPVVPFTDPVVPFINPMEPPGPGPAGPPTGPPNPSFGPLGAKPGHLVAANKQQDSPAPDSETPDSETTAPLPINDIEGDGDIVGEIVDFTPEDALTVAEGQQVIVNAAEDKAVIAPLSAEDFINLLEGPLISGFALEIPGIGNLRQSFERLFPGIPLPYYWLPSVPIPPIRFPFPF
ncbi:MAG: hypothetical protein DCF17_11795 [Shackletoniella antarctica]|uniref:FecR protein domain-containing protein n=1 Tax=Shackletoniella antarctica TaxID=268115 RepID=A0A2W4W7J7_9CYAN|nr:MAG: hypothetical protein DCF17_11795 [Shackletoniella antarctica]